MPRKPAVSGNIEIHFAVQDREKQPNWSHQQCWLHQMDPIRFVEQSIAYDGSPCCSMSGGFGIVVDGKPWNGDDEPDYEGIQEPLHFYHDDMYMTLGFPGGVVDILQGRKKTSFYYYDECDGHIERVGNRTIRMWDNYAGKDDTVIELDLVHFGRALLEKGRELQAFWEVMVREFNARADQETNNHVSRKLNRRIQHVEEWKLGKLMDHLERLLNDLQFFENGDIIWPDFQSVIGEHKPTVTVGKGPYDGHDYFDLSWEKISPELHQRIEEFLWAHSDNGFSWRNPLLKRTKKHWPFRWKLDHNPPSLTLKARAPRPLKPEIIDHIGVYLCLPWNWEGTGKDRPHGQAWLEEIDAADWYEQLKTQSGPLMGNFIVVLQNVAMNGKWIHLPKEDEWRHKVEMSTLKEALEFPKAIHRLLRTKEKQSWGQHFLSWDGRPDTLLFEMKGKKAKAPIADAVYYVIYYELELLLKKGKQLRKLAKGDEQVLKMLEDIPFEELPGMIADLKAAYKKMGERFRRQK